MGFKSIGNGLQTFCFFGFKGVERTFEALIVGTTLARSFLLRFKARFKFLVPGTKFDSNVNCVKGIDSWLILKIMSTNEFTRIVPERSQYKAWCYTLNNYTEEDVERLQGLVDGVEYHVFGKEVGGSGTPHLQGFIKFEKRKRCMAVKALIGSNPHVEYAHHPNQAAQYCKKDADYFEHGTLEGAGKRTDIDEFKAYVQQAVVEKRKVYDEDLRQEFSSLYARSAKFMKEYRDDHRIEQEVETHQLRDWQIVLNTDLNREPEVRKIIFIVDETGNAGKSWFARYYRSLHLKTTQILKPGKIADMAYELSERARVVFLDCPRAKQQEYIQYDFLESIKDGYIFSPKYESRMKVLDKCHMVVLMNESPDQSKLSLDRYDIRRI